MSTTPRTSASAARTPSATLPSNDEPYVVDRDEGEHRHFLNHLATTKIDPGESGTMSAIEFVAPKGFGPPLHVHEDEDEMMIVLDGEIVFRSGDREQTGVSGSTVFLPRGVPHTFQVLSETARFTTVTASTKGTPQFGRFVAELGEELSEPVTPEPVEIDPGAVAESGARYGVAILGPPPAPLAS